MQQVGRKLVLDLEPYDGRVAGISAQKAAQHTLSVKTEGWVSEVDRSIIASRTSRLRAPLTEYLRVGMS